MGSGGMCHYCRRGTCACDELALMNTSGLDEETCHLLLSGVDEHYIVSIIKQFLRTPEQKIMLDTADISIEESLNGRYMPAQGSFIQAMYEDWNTKLGRKYF